METITIQRQEYDRLKELENKIDLNLLFQFHRSLENVKQGKIRRVA